MASSVPNNGRFPSNNVVKAPLAIDIAKVLECPVCFEMILPPVFPCEMGHSVCTSCRKNVQSCPVCRSKFVNCRNIFIESLLNCCRISCKYNGYGCLVICCGNTLALHEQKCDFRWVDRINKNLD